MGLRLPIYPYHAAQGKCGVKKNSASYHNNVAFEEMQQFADYLSDPVIRGIAFNVIPPLGRRSVPTREWFEPALFDDDNWDHKELADLMTRVGRNGTIIVPDLTHIMGKKEHLPPSVATRKLMTRFHDEDIEVLPLVLKLPSGPAYDLRKFPRSFRRTNAPAPELFELMPEIARLTVNYLHHSAISGNGKRPPARRRQLVPARPQI